MRALYLLSYNGGGWCRVHSGSAPALGAERRSTRQVIVMVVSTNATNATVVAVVVNVGVRSVRIGDHGTPSRACPSTHFPRVAPLAHTTDSRYTESVAATVPAVRPRRPEWFDTLALVTAAAAVVLLGTGGLLVLTRPTAAPSRVVVVQAPPATAAETTVWTEPPTTAAPAPVVTYPPVTAAPYVPPVSPPVSLDIDWGATQPRLCEVANACRKDG